LFAVPRRWHSGQALEDVRDLTKPIQEELERFFVATDELEDKKLDIVAGRDPKRQCRPSRTPRNHSRKRMNRASRAAYYVIRADGQHLGCGLGDIFPRIGPATKRILDAEYSGALER
jgi:hypothetical protein